MRLISLLIAGLLAYTQVSAAPTFQPSDKASRSLENTAPALRSQLLNYEARKLWAEDNITARGPEEGVEELFTRSPLSQGAKAAMHHTLQSQAAKKAGHAPPPRPLVSAADRHEAHIALAAAGQKHRQTSNLPGRKDTFTHAGQTWSGMDARKAVFNAHLHAGSKVDQMPKKFNNRPYPPKHPTHAGQLPVPGLSRHHGGKGKEYPVEHGGAGWLGGVKPPARVMIGKKKNGQNKFAGIVSHTPGATGPFQNSHYLAQQHRPPRKLKQTRIGLHAMGF